MFFTQDDYKKIQQWLTKNSVKDTEFNEANIPFNGEETITIVQGNQNKKVFLKDLVAQVFNLGISDFVNITDKYDAPNISLEEAIRLIPSRARKEGQVITFLDMEDHWHIYQFKGVLNQWNVLDTWEDLFDWEKLIIDSILPDEEDLTKSEPDANGNSYLSLKDRKYNPEDFSGLGRVILRKNIMEVEDPIYGKVKKNVLYQDMFTQSNTIYEIRYDFDLNGSEITIPEGCVLNFQGGSLNNGTIKGSNTIIKSSPYKIFDTELNITGTWIIDCFYPNWVGVKGDNTDETEVIQKAIDIANFTKCGKIKFLNGVYKVTSLNLTGLIGLTIEGANHGFGTIIGYASGNTKFYVYGKDSVGFDLSNAKSVTIKDIEFYSQEANEEDYPSTFILMGRSLTENGEYNHTNSNKLINLEFYGRCKYFGLLINNAEINDFYNLEFSGYFGKACIGLLSTNNYVASPFVSLIKTGVSTTCNSFHKCNLINYMVPDVSDQNENRIISCVYSNNGHFNTAFRDSYIRTTSTSDTVCMRGFVLDSREEGTGNVIEGGLEISNIRQEGYGNVGEFFYACGYYQIMNIFISNCFTITNKEHSAVITFKPKCRNINISGIHPLSGSNRNFQFNTIEASRIDVIKEGELLFDGEYIAYSILRSSNKFSDNILSHLVYNSVAIDAINVKIGSIVNIGDDKVSFNRSFVLPSIGDLNGSIGIKGLSNTSYDLKFNNKFGEKSIAYRWFGDPNSVSDFNWLKSDSAGTTFLDTSGPEAKAMWWNGSQWIDNEGYPSNYKKKGATEERPTIGTYSFKGFQYFDTTLNKPIWWTGEKWVDATGADV